TVEVDIKDESGNVSFARGVPKIAHDRAAKAYLGPAKVAREAHAAGMYLIGRVVTFEDPVTSVAHPELAIKTRDGSVWKTSGGLGGLNPANPQTVRPHRDLAPGAA